MRVTRRVMVQTGSNKHSSKTAATPKWKRTDRLQRRFDRLAGPVVVTKKEG